MLGSLPIDAFNPSWLMKWEQWLMFENKLTATCQSAAFINNACGHFDIMKADQ